MPGLTAVSRLVLLALADKADDLGNCTLGESHLHEATCCDRKSILAAVRKLEARGALEIERGHGKVNEYTLVLSYKGDDVAVDKVSKEEEKEPPVEVDEVDKPVPKTVLDKQPVPKTVLVPPVPKTVLVTPPGTDLALSDLNLKVAKETATACLLESPLDVTLLPNTRAQDPVHFFAKPSKEEVDKYCKDKGYNVDGEAFVAYYESVGWRVGRHSMKCWKSAVVTWVKRGKSNGGGNGSGLVKPTTDREWGELARRHGIKLGAKTYVQVWNEILQASRKGAAGQKR
jgi:hypothetical protein